MRRNNGYQRGLVDDFNPCRLTVIVDITRPLVDNFETVYNDELASLVVTYNVTDPESDLLKILFGLGFTEYDSDLSPFSVYHNRTMLVLDQSQNRLPEGVFMFGRLRAFNNVELTKTVTAPEPLFLDFSPPFPGNVSDGELFAIAFSKG